MIELPRDATKEDWARAVVRQNHAGSIEYRLELTLERIEAAQHTTDLPQDEKDKLTDIETKVKAALDAVKEWRGDEDDD